MSKPDLRELKKPRSGGRSRQRRALLLTTVTAMGITLALVLGNFLTHRFSARIDVTSARDQRLAPRTEQLLSQIDQPYRIVIAAEMESIDVRSRQRLNDVLKEVNRFNNKVNSRMIDTASVRGTTEYKALVAELVARDERLIRDQVAAVELGAAASNSMSTYLSETLAPALGQVQEAIPSNEGAAGNNRQYFEQAAAAVRLLSRDLAAAAGRAGDALKSRINDIPVPATDKAAAAMVESLGSTVEQLTSLGRELRKFTGAGAAAGPAGDLARPLLADVEQRRDQAAVLLDSMRRLKRLDVLRIIDVLRTGSAALVIGPPEVGLGAIDIDALLPSTTWLEVSNKATGDLNRRVEELVATSITSLLNPVRPIVVIVHAELRPFFDKVPLFTAATERLSLRGVEVIEWAVMVDPAPPRMASLNPDGSRPVVYATISPDSSAASAGQGLPSGVDRARKLGEVITTLAGEGKNILLSINPSVLPTYGDPDPITAVLARFGLAAESGRPILRERVTPQGRFIETDQILQPLETPHLVSGAVRGLPTRFPWPISLVERPSTEQVRLEITSLYAMPANTSTWVESQWLQLWQTPRDQRSLLPDAPVFDEGRDGRWPQGQATDKPQQWVTAAAAERFEVGQVTQRLIAVGSNSWYIDQVTQPQMEVDGRSTLANVGNLEFFESAVYWLARNDDQIAQSPTSQAVAIIQPVEETTLSRIRLALVLVLPATIIIIGGLYRLIRR